MPMKLRVFIAFAVLGGGILSAQQPFSGPVEGYTFDSPTRSIRAVNGTAGSSHLGSALWSGMEFGSAAPQRDYALAFYAPAFGESRCLIVSGLSSDQPSSATLPGPCSVPQGVEWSGDGSVAILYSRAENWIRIVTGLPSAPASGAALGIGMLGGSLSAVASDTGGTRVAIGVAGGKSDGIYEILNSQGAANNGTFVPVLLGVEPTALAFSGDGGTLYGIDGASRQLNEINAADFTSQTWALSPLEDPVALRWGTDADQKKLVYVAGFGDRSLATFDASSRQMIASLPLNFQPTAVTPLGQNSFILRPRTEGLDPLWALSNAPAQAIYFIPATPIPQRGGRRQ
jgi:hypothetical protein